MNDAPHSAAWPALTIPYHVDSGDGVPIVLLHGAITDHRFSAPLAMELAGEWRCLAVSLDGYYPARPDPTAFSADRHAWQLHALLRSLGEPAHLIGHSRGGRIALHVGARWPELLRSLILVEAGGVAEPGFITEDASPSASTPSSDDPKARISAYVDAGFGLGSWGTLPGSLRQIMLDNANTLSLSAGDPTLPLSRPTAQAVKVATLLVEGSASPSKFHAVNDALAHAIPRAERVCVDGADHLLPYVSPGLLADTLRPFLRVH